MSLMKGSDAEGVALCGMSVYPEESWRLRPRGLEWGFRVRELVNGSA